jgi:hypothetical protein
MSEPPAADGYTMHARRIDGNFYDYECGEMQGSGSWAHVVTIARQHKVDAVKINNAKFRHDGEPAAFTVTAKQLSPHGWLHLINRRS